MGKKAKATGGEKGCSQPSRHNMMDEEALKREFQRVAMSLGDSVYHIINQPEYVGTEAESGYLLMLFNVQAHDGRSTMVSSCTDRGELRQLLQFALDNLDGPMAEVVTGDADPVH